MARKVLVADDSVTIQKVVGLTFANEDIELSFVDNGEDAITLARKLRPDLILADVLMPGRSGYEVCEFVKTDPDLRHTPVLLLTGTFEPFDADRCAQVRADGTITKPFESQTLIRQVRELLDRPCQRAAPAEAPPAISPPQSVEAALAPDTAGALAFEASIGGGDDNIDLRIEAFQFSRDPETALNRQGLDVPQTAGEGAGEDWLAAPEEDVQEEDAQAPPASALPQDEDVWDLSDFEAVEEASTGDDEAGASADEPETLWNEAAAEAIDIVESTNLDMENESPLTEASTLLEASPEPFDEPIDRATANDGAAAGIETSENPTEIVGENEFDEFDLSPADEAASFDSSILDLDTPEPKASGGGGEIGREILEGGGMLDELTLEEIPEDEDFAAVPQGAVPPQAVTEPEAPLAGLSSEKSADIVREAVRDAVEKVTWEAFSDLSETVVRAVQEKVEKIAWEVIPQMAETIIKEEIRKLKDEDK
ncbi:MAG: response regulator [Deltaproteobacteria bacterium]|nr:response regulator [Deltaproteobacteria bacterium]